jgi:DDE superfamily endonuclease
VPSGQGERDPLGVDQRACRERLAAFRREFYWSLTRWSDALFELTDAVLCAPGPVTSLPELSMVGVHRRGHGSTYAALVDGQMDVGRLGRALAGLPLPRGGDGQIRLAVDVTPWPRPDAECSPGRAHAHRPCRCDGVRQTIPGWPYSIVAALESGRCSWTLPLDAVRLVPGQDATDVTAAQIRQVVGRLHTAGQRTEQDPPILVVMDAGYDVIRLAHLLADLPVRLLGRVRADRVFHGPVRRSV